MIIETRIKRLEGSLSTNNLLSQKDRCQAINVPYGLDSTQQTEFTETERARILTELHETHGPFNEENILWINVIFFGTQHPDPGKEEVANEY
jgi:hypothetical protein